MPLLKSSSDPDLKNKMKLYSRLIMNTDVNVLYKVAEWDGCNGESRKKLLDILQSFISPKKMIESGKLEQLLKQSVMFQVYTCKFHDPDASKMHTYSLLEKHQCSKVPVPNKYLMDIDHHEDEVWMITISPNGLLMASASKDKSIAIWKLHQEGTTLNIEYYTEVKKPNVNSIMWNHDSDKILIGAENCHIFDTTAKIFSHEFKTNSGRVSSAIWVDSSTKVVVAESEKYMKMWSIDGSCLKIWENFFFIDLVGGYEGKFFAFLAGGTKKIHFVNIENKQIEHEIEEED